MFEDMAIKIIIQIINFNSKKNWEKNLNVPQ